jgi:hypothetical protein
MSDRETPTSYAEVSRVRNPDTDYVTIILDVWKGDRDDPAVEVIRYLSLFSVEEAPEVFLFNDGYYSTRLKEAQKPIIWKEIGHQKTAVQEAKQHKGQYEQMTREDRYGYGVVSRDKERYMAFMDAIDALHEDPQDEEAWKKVDSWRSHMATLHEK